MRRVLRIIIGLLAAVTICLGLGWGIMQLGKLYLSVIGNNIKVVDNLPAGEEAGEKQLVKLPGFDVYYLQLGVFQELENANKLANELQLAGIRAVVLRGTPNKVVTGYFGQLAAAKSERTALKNVNAVEKSIAVKGLSFKATPGDGQKLGALLSEYSAVLSQGTGVFNTSDATRLKTKDLLGLNKAIATLNQDNDQYLKALIGDQTRIPAKPVLSAMQVQSKNLQQNLQGVCNSQSRENYTRLQENYLRLLDLYLEYLEILRNKPVN